MAQRAHVIVEVLLIERLGLVLSDGSSAYITPFRSLRPNRITPAKDHALMPQH